MLTRRRRTSWPPGLRWRLFTAQRRRWEVTGDEADLDAAVRTLETVADEPDVEELTVLDLVETLIMRYQARGHRADITRARALTDRLLDRAGTDDFVQLSVWQYLVRMTTLSFLETGDLTALDAVIAEGSAIAESIAPVAATDPARFDDALHRLRTNLANAHISRYSASAMDRDLVRGLAELTGLIDEHADSGEPAPHASEYRPYTLADRRMDLYHLGVATTTRSLFMADAAATDAAIQLLDSAYQNGAPLGVDPPAVSNLTAIALQLANTLSQRGTAADRERAIDLIRSTMAGIAPDDPRRGAAAGIAASVLFNTAEDSDDLTDAMAFVEESVGMSGPLITSQAGRLITGIVHSQRYQSTGDETAAGAAVDAYEAVFDTAARHHLSPVLTQTAHAQRALLAARQGDWTTARQHFDAALDLAIDLYSVQALRGSKEAMLGYRSDLPLSCAQARIRCGDPEGAALALEEGRAILLSETLERDHADLARLAATRPDLVTRYRAAAAEVRALNTPNPMLHHRIDGSEARRVTAVHAARERFDGVVAEIRRQPEHAAFLRRPTIDTVYRAAAVLGPEHPLVYLASLPDGGFALALDGAERRVRTAELPDLTTAALTEWVTRLADAYAARHTDPYGWSAELDGLADRLGTVLAPLRDLLGPVPAVTMVPTGLIGLLPLHIARHDGKRYLSDELAIAFAPNARSLGTRAASGTANRLLLVEDPRPDRTPVRHAAEEAAAVARHFLHVDRLNGASATRDRILDNLGAPSVVHFICHGHADLRRPLNTALQAADTDLTVADLLASALSARLVVLSACETAVPGTDLPDEVVGLPSALLQTGVGGVLATMWAVDGASAALLTAAFYDEWRTGAPAYVALHRARRWLRSCTAGAAHARFPAILPVPPRIDSPAAHTLWANGRPFRHPRFWGAFVYIGTG